jgi:hypothetical protein
MTCTIRAAIIPPLPGGERIEVRGELGLPSDMRTQCDCNLEYSNRFRNPIAFSNEPSSPP